MRVTVDSADLAEVLGWVKGAINPRASFPVLTGALLTAAEGRLRVEASDTQTTARRWVPASVEEDGRAVAPHRLLEVAGRLPDGKVSLSAADGRLTVEAGTMTAAVSTLDADDWPQFPQPDDGGVTVPAATWTLAAKRVAPGVSRHAPAPWAAGVLVQGDGEQLTFTAVNDPRVVRLSTTVDGPGAALSMAVEPEVVTLAASLEADLKVSATDDVVSLIAPGASIVSTLLSAQPPDLSSLLATDGSESWADPDDEALLEALGRATTLLGAQANVPVEVAADTDGAVVLSYTGDLGSLDEVVEGGTSGEWQTWVNPSYLTWAIKSLDGGLARMSLTARKAIRCESRDGAITTLFMSMRGAPDA